MNTSQVLNDFLNQPAPPHLQAPNTGDAIQDAIDYGIDIEHLRRFHALTMDERLARLQAMVNFIVEVHALREANSTTP